jgi:hypothetical protein
MVINKELYAQTTKELRKTGCVLPSPLDSEFARIVCNPTFTPTLRQHLAGLCFRVEPKSLGGASCYDPGPSKFLSIPLSTLVPPALAAPVPMDIDQCPATPEDDDMPAIYHLAQKHGHIDLPRGVPEGEYPEGFPDSPCSQ